jgi:hypothetical protein
MDYFSDPKSETIPPYQTGVSAENPSSLFVAKYSLPKKKKSKIVWNYDI